MKTPHSLIRLASENRRLLIKSIGLSETILNGQKKTLDEFEKDKKSRLIKEEVARLRLVKTSHTWWFTSEERSDNLIAYCMNCNSKVFPGFLDDREILSCSSDMRVSRIIGKPYL